jgi:methyl coenzyme M reductase subunit C-like uncharacterized protein (methanogenesis marker protein 7)
MPSLVAIEEEIENILDSFATDGALVPVEVVDYLADLAVQEERKAAAICAVLRRMGSSADAIDAEIAYLSQRKASIKNAELRLREYVKSVMAGKGIQKIKSDTGTLFIRENERVIINGNPQDLPSEFVQQRIDYVPNKVAIKDAIKAGREIKGVTIEKNYTLGTR